MADTITTDLGPVTAYADAVAHGYTGTREDFGKLLAGAGKNLENAVDASNEAKAAAENAENAAQTAADAAGTAGQAAGVAGSAAEAANTSAGEAAKSAEAAETAQQGAENAAKKAVEAKTGAENALKDADTAKDAASGYADAATESATAAAASATNASASAKSAFDAAQKIEDSAEKIERNADAVSQLKEDIGNLTIIRIGENKCTNDNEVYGSTIYLPVYLEEGKSYIVYNPTSEVLKGCAIYVTQKSGVGDSNLITVKPTGWVTPNPKDKTQSFLSNLDTGWYRIKLSYQSVFTDEQKAMYGTGWMVKEIPNIDYVPTSFDYVEYKEDILAKESVNAEKANYAEKAGSIAQKEENVACTGDSLTYGYGANPGSTDYPTVLAGLCNKTIYNLGVSGESTDEILARQGGFPAVVNPVTIPADTSSVEITFAGAINIGGGNTSLLRKASSNLVNPVVIDGVEGNISSSNNKYYFTRLKNGTVHEIKRPQYVITKEMREHKDDIQIIFMGTNGGWMITADDAETRIKKLTSQIDMMIDYNTSKKYIIIGMHYFYSWVLYNGLTKEQLENAMLLKYGNHYINLRKYMIEYGLADAGLTATEADTEAINNGNVPPSLLFSDGIHGNSYFYNILANLVNKKGIELGYWN